MTNEIQTNGEVMAEMTEREIAAREQLEQMLIQATISELYVSWPRFLVAVLKRIRKRTGLAKLDAEHIRIINTAMQSYKPDR